MKIGLAQINGTVGDLPANARRIVNAYREAVDQGAEFVITPEMALVGYPPRDLVFKSGFVDKCLQALDYLGSEIGEVPLLVGYVDHNRGESPGKPFRNGAALLENGEVMARVFKTLLPTYDIFDERRYFEPAERCEPVEWRGRKLGITICEDVWTEDYLHRPLYKRDPVEELQATGAEVLINLSASPFHLGKAAVRRELLSMVAKSTGLPLVYCNSIGGNDQLVFDGNSVVMNGEGVLRAQLAAFLEEVRVIDIDLESGPETEAIPETADPEASEEIFRALVLGVGDYVGKCGFRTACMGLSGGIDSALTAAVAVKGAMGPLFGDLPEDVTEENMQARIRGLYLMSLSNKHNHLLLTTGNKSEVAVGYCTIYGDMCGGLAVISDLPKTRVFEVARWLNRDGEVIPWSTIEKPPSAELRPDQKDEDSLPPYGMLDEILELYVEKQCSPEEIIESHGFKEETVRWVQRQVDLNEWKRHQAAPGIRVTSKAFGIGRRIPIVQRFGR
jgi:NH3-dependent NAD+ synthetase/predicted amidohydrolase